MSDHIDKIRKIIAKAKSTAHEGEAETFMAKAEALLKAHGLSLSDIPVGDDPMGHQRQKTPDSWQRGLLATVAEYFECGAVLQGKTVIIYGRESARITTLEMWPYILKSVGDKAKLLRNSYPQSVAVSRRKVGRALEQILCIKIHERRSQQEVEPTGPGIVPVNDLDAYKDETWGELGMHTGRAQPTTAQAVALAGQINLDQQIKSEQRLLT